MSRPSQPQNLRTYAEFNCSGFRAPNSTKYGGLLAARFRKPMLLNIDRMMPSCPHCEHIRSSLSWVNVRTHGSKTSGSSVLFGTQTLPINPLRLSLVQYP